MSEEKVKTEADQPTLVRVEMAPETVQRLAELMPAVGLWAKAEGGEQATAPGDVIALSIALMHSMVFERAHDMIAGEVAPTVQ